VACAFEIAAGVAGDVAAGAVRPVAVVSFADEEGARFNTPTFGSKALSGRLDLPAVLARRDDAGVVLGDAMRAVGVDPDRIGEAPHWLGKLAGFIEVHIDQTTELARAGEPVGLVSSLAARTRLEVWLRGRADHAGTTPRGERRDALAAAARLIVGAEDLADADPSLTVTSSRILARPNAPTTIAAEVRLWIDARASEGFAAIDAWRSRLDDLVGGLAAQTGVEIDLSVASRSDAREFSPALRASLARASENVTGRPAPEVVCFAGHDAGVLAERVPAAMVLVRNETGVSHSPEEDVDLEDAAVAARVVADALTLASVVA
jgi:N-carbamoyl-L-amino-acid hydrolase